jgi:hypothetical protein
MMATVLNNRQDYNIFVALLDDEEKSDKVWLYVDSEHKLQGPLNSVEVN